MEDNKSIKKEEVPYDVDTEDENLKGHQDQAVDEWTMNLRSEMRRLWKDIAALNTIKLSIMQSIQGNEEKIKKLENEANSVRSELERRTKALAIMDERKAARDKLEKERKLRWWNFVEEKLREMADRGLRNLMVQVPYDKITMIENFPYENEDGFLYGAFRAAMKMRMTETFDDRQRSGRRTTLYMSHEEITKTLTEGESLANLLAYGLCKECWTLGPITQLCVNEKCQGKKNRYWTQWYTHNGKKWYINAVEMFYYLKTELDREVETYETFLVLPEDIWSTRKHPILYQNRIYYLMGVEPGPCDDMLPGFDVEEPVMERHKVFELAIRADPGVEEDELKAGLFAEHIKWVWHRLKRDVYADYEEFERKKKREILRQERRERKNNKKAKV